MAVFERRKIISLCKSIENILYIKLYLENLLHENENFRQDS